MEQAILLILIFHAGLNGDPSQPAPPEAAKMAAIINGIHLNNEDIISMPDKWEYPWYAAWDLAFHCVPLAMVDPAICQRPADIILTGMVYASQRTSCLHTNGLSVM